MTTLDASDSLLPELTEVTPLAQQWRLARIRLINWGGFQGSHSVDVQGLGVLITGATGSGKSSLLDAWTAVMQNPSGTAYNAASNDTKSQRAAGARTALTYARGMMGERPAEDGYSAQALNLRDGNTWSAIGLVFMSTASEMYTVGRLMVVPATAERPGDMTNRWFAIRRDLDLQQFQPLMREGKGVDKRRTEAAIAGLSLYSSWKDAANEAFLPVLGIGKGGDGDKALRLLHSIQRSGPVNNVDDLFKEKVLDEPSTFSRFDQGIAEFDALTQSHRKFAEIAKKITVLSPIVDAKTRLDEALSQSITIDSYGDLAARDSAFARWRAEVELRFLDEEETALVAERDGLRAQIVAASTQKDRLTGELEEIQSAWQANDGDRVGELERAKHIRTTELGLVEKRRRDFAQATSAFGPVPETSEAWQETVTRAKTTIADAARRLAELDELKGPTQGELYQYQRERDTARKQLEKQKARQGNIDETLDDIRLMLAGKAGLTRAALPFAAELIDMAEGEDGWRAAADAVLGAFGRTLLVDQAIRGDFNRAINNFPPKRRIQIHSAETDLGAGGETLATPGTLASKLRVDTSSPFAGWLRAQLDSRFKHLCVETPGELIDDGLPRVTRTGQERRGQRGAHGGGKEPLIGFSNAARVKLLAEQVQRAQQALDKASAKIAEIDAEARTLRAQHDAARSYEGRLWQDFDAATLRTALTEIDDELSTLLQGSDVLEELRRRRDTKRQAIDDVTRKLGAVEADLGRVEDRWSATIDRKDEAARVVDQLDEAGVQLSAEQQAGLDERLAADGCTSAPDLPGALVRITKALRQENDRANTDRTKAEQEILGAIARYHEHWEDPDLGRGLDSYTDYAEILCEHQQTGVAERRRAWADQVMVWIGEHALQMDREITEASEQIDERLDPIRAVLTKVPFGAHGHRLAINAQPLNDRLVKDFRSQLTKLADGLTSAEIVDEATAIKRAEKKFEQIDKVLSQVRIKTADGGDNRRIRNQLLDVRQHHRFTADELDAHGDVVAMYRSLGGKSGGETQELVAFITGAALRYQLGDENRSRPRFAPVLLDEAFIKADSNTSHRGANALATLGFQPIVVAPEGSLNALEPHFDRIFVIIKAVDGKARVAPIIKPDVAVAGQESRSTTPIPQTPSPETDVVNRAQTVSLDTPRPELGVDDQ